MGSTGQVSGGLHIGELAVAGPVDAGNLLITRSLSKSSRRPRSLGLLDCVHEVRPRILCIPATMTTTCLNRHDTTLNSRLPDLPIDRWSYVAAVPSAPRYARLVMQLYVARLICMRYPCTQQGVMMGI